MRNFRLRLNPPATSYLSTSVIPVYLQDVGNIIGVCRQGYVENMGLVGAFDLNVDVRAEQFVLYYFRWPDSPEREFVGIIIMDAAENANTIGNSVI